MKQQTTQSEPIGESKYARKHRLQHIGVYSHRSPFRSEDNLTEQMQGWIETVLSNDEASSDEELIRYFVENGLNVDTARRLVQEERTAYLNAGGRRP